MARVVIWALATSMAFPAAAATVEVPREGFVFFRGPIIKGDAQRLRKALQTKPYNGAVTLLLNSPGGDYDEGIAMAGVIISRKRQVAVVAAIPWAWECSSSCVSMFAAASRREVATYGTDKAGKLWGGGAVYVHTTGSMINGKRVIDSDSIATTWAWSRTLRGLGVPAVVVKKLLETTSPYGELVTEDELKQWGVGFRKP
jgi:hypothetical protein